MLRVAPKTPIRHAILGMLSSDSSTKVLRSLTSARLSDSPKTFVSFTPFWSLLPWHQPIDEASHVPNSNLRIHSKIWAVFAGGKKLFTMQHEAFQEVLPVHECIALSSWNGRHVIVSLVLCSFNTQDWRGY